MTGSPFSDRRQHERFACDLEVSVRRSQSQAPSDSDVVARAEDVSRGGICMRTGETLDRGSVVDVSMTLLLNENAQSEPLVLPSRVVWCTEMDEGYQVGCMFLALTSEQREYLELFLRFLRGKVKSPMLATAFSSTVPPTSVKRTKGGDPFSS